jgi:hypothetical protein
MRIVPGQRRIGYRLLAKCSRSCHAARNGWDDLLQRIYDEGRFDNELFDWGHDRPLRDAAESGHLSTCRLILGITKRYRSMTAWRLLPCVAMGGNLDVLHFFLSEETNLDRRLYIQLLECCAIKRTLLKSMWWHCHCSAFGQPDLEPVS